MLSTLPMDMTVSHNGNLYSMRSAHITSKISNAGKYMKVRLSAGYGQENIDVKCKRATSSLPETEDVEWIENQREGTAVIHQLQSYRKHLVTTTR